MVVNSEYLLASHAARIAVPVACSNSLLTSDFPNAGVSPSELSVEVERATLVYLSLGLGNTAGVLLLSGTFLFGPDLRAGSNIDRGRGYQIRATRSCQLHRVEREFDDSRSQQFSRQRHLSKMQVRSFGWLSSQRTGQ